MLFDYSPRFEKQWVKVPKKIKTRALERLNLLLVDEFNPQLGNHKLVSIHAPFRSINVTGAWRILYCKMRDEIILLYAIGTHRQLYG